MALFSTSAASRLLCLAGVLLLAWGGRLVRRELRRNHALTSSLIQANTSWANEVHERQRSQQHAKVQHEVAHAAAESVSLAQAAPRFLQGIGKPLGWQFGEWWTVDPTTKLMRLACRWYDTGDHAEDEVLLAEFAQASLGWTFARGKGLPGAIWQDGLARWEHDLTSSPCFLRTEAAKKAGLHRAFAFPLRGGEAGEVNGVMMFLGQEQGTPDPELVAAMDTLASQVTQFAERCRAEAGLRASQARFTAFIENAPALAYIKDAEGRMVYGNETLLRVFGVTREDWVGKTDADFWPEATAALRENDLRVLSGESAIETKESVPLPDGRMRQWLSYKFPLHDETTGGKLLAGISVDITAREEAEENCRAREEAERSNREKSRFLSRVSHELRTPLNAILGFGQLLQTSNLRGQDAEALDYILKSGRHLLALVDEVLDLSRAEGGEAQLSPVEVEASELVAECLGLVDHLAQTRQIICRVGNLSTAMLWCDAKRLRQVLLNLLSNAIKYNREGGEVWVHGRLLDGQRLRLEIVDTGPGIAPDDLARLFVPFTRLTHAAAAGADGVGLGLVASRRVLRAMGGELGLESQVGVGSTAWLELPLGERPTAAPFAMELDTEALLALADL